MLFELTEVASSATRVEDIYQVSLCCLGGTLGSLLPVLQREGIAAVAFIPLRVSGALLGKFMVYHSQPHRFRESEVMVAQTIATQVAFAILSRKSAEAMRAQRDHPKASATL